MTGEQMTAPGSAILSAEELRRVIDAVDYAANDYAYRGDDENLGWNAPDEAQEFRDKAAALSRLADTLRERAGIEVNRS